MTDATDSPTPFYQKPLTFVKKHKTIIACSATAVAAAVVTRKFDTNLLRIMNGSNIELAKEHGILLVQNDGFQSFIAEKGMSGELAAFLTKYDIEF